MKIHTTYLDHVVLTVSDLDKSREWWSKVTGSHATTDHEGEVSLLVGAQAIRLRPGMPAAAGTVSICLMADTSIAELYRRAEELHVVHGEVHPRTAATAPVQALTLQDPDGYRVELATGTPEGVAP